MRLQQSREQLPAPPRVCCHCICCAACGGLPLLSTAVRDVAATEAQQDAAAVAAAAAAVGTAAPLLPFCCCAAAVHVCGSVQPLSRMPAQLQHGGMKQLGRRQPSSAIPPPMDSSLCSCLPASCLRRLPPRTSGRLDKLLAPPSLHYSQHADGTDQYGCA